MIYLIERPHLIPLYLSFLLFLWFLFISISANSRYRKQSVVMAVAWCFYCCCFIFKLFDPLTYIEMLKSLILIDVVTGLILVTNHFISRYSCKLALTLAFAVACHSMILLYISTDSLEVKVYAFGFYKYYDELLAMVGILQLLVSYDGGFLSGIRGITRSFRSLSVRYRRAYVRGIHYIKILFTRKKRESQK